MAMDDCSSISNSLTSTMLSPTSSLDKNNKWWIVHINKVIDVEEAKKEILFSLPMVFVTSCFYFINLVSLMFAGHLGKLELAASNLANPWAMVTSLSFMNGGNTSSNIISFLFSIIISVIWWYSDTILISLHQDPDITKKAGTYVFLQNILRFLQAQSIIMLLVVCSVGCLVIHIGIAYGLVHWASLGFKGAPLAASISIWISVLMLGVYVLCSKRFSCIWRDGFSFEPFHYIVINLKLAVPVLLWCVFGHNTWAGLFSNSTEIINKFATMTPLLLISFLFDFFQGIYSGVARGCGWQHLAMCINLATFYFIGMPIAGLLAFKFNLHAQGLWMGLICGLACQACGLLLLTLLIRWEKVEASTKCNRENELLTQA
ncbi:unnamed protein product [Withania somnifera]